MTDEFGRAVLSVLPRFGETLRVTGREPGDEFARFEAALPVSGALPLAGARLAAGVPGVGLIDTLAANLEALVSGGARLAGGWSSSSTTTTPTWSSPRTEPMSKAR